MAAIAAALALIGVACDSSERGRIAPSPAASSSANIAPPLEPFRLWLPRGPTEKRRAGSCGLDRIGNPSADVAFAIVAGESFLAEGWVADANQGALPKVAWLVLQGERGDFHVPLELGYGRPDVAATLGKRALVNSGYRVHATTTGLPSGEYWIAIHSVDPKGLLTCDTRRIARIVSR